MIYEFQEAIRLLRDLADLQNGAPLEQYRKQWEETMEDVYAFLGKWEAGIENEEFINETEIE
jgi:hypothetical protein